MKSFEDQLMDLQADMVDICLEFSGDIAEKIYIYGSCEGRMIEGNVFYKMNGEICHKETVAKAHGYSLGKSSSLIHQVLMILIEDLEKIKALCEESERPCPTEMKMIFDVKTQRFEAAYQYEPQYSHRKKNDLAPGEIFDRWFKEIQMKTK